MKVFITTAYFLFHYVFSVVVIEGPQELVNLFRKKTGRDNITASYANFGRIPYGYQIVII